MNLERISLPVEYLFEFPTFGSWLNNAQAFCRPYRGEALLMITADGYLAHIGEDFMAARKNAQFPIKVYRAIRYVDRPALAE